MHTPCYDERIMMEYRDVLSRPKFKFPPLQVEALLDVFICDGILAVPDALSDADVKDEDDRAFYEVAVYCNAPLVSGNLKHYPAVPLAMSPADFCTIYLLK